MRCIIMLAINTLYRYERAHTRGNGIFREHAVKNVGYMYARVNMGERPT